jgi:hypothetical protein
VENIFCNCKLGTYKICFGGLFGVLSALFCDFWIIFPKLKIPIKLLPCKCKKEGK